MPEETAQNPTFDQAAEAAMATLSQPAAVVEDAKGDTEPATEPTQEQTQTETPAKESVESDELLSAEEVATLDDAGKANYKKMQKAFTEKTQKLAAERKEAEAYKPYEEFIKAYQADPKSLIKQLASQHGLSLAEAAQLQEPVKAPEPSADMKIKLRTLLGEGNEELADGLAGVFADELGKTVKPIEERQTEALKKAATEAADADLKAFEKTHPDFKTHEAAMRELSLKLQPAANAKMDVGEYLEMLYKVASLKDSEATQTQKVLDRINKAAASSEPQSAAVPTSKVTPASPKRPTIEEAFEAAKKGIQW
jgi:hypothetical protein